VKVVRLRPGTTSGSVRAPPSKSYSHRGLVAGHLSGRTYQLLDPLDSEDTRATAVGVSRLGTPVARRPGEWIVRKHGEPEAGDRVVIECGESGTTLRFLTAVAARSNAEVVLRGRGRLPRRPVEELLGALRTLGATARRDPADGSVRVQGPLRAGTVILDASISSQFASALLFVLPTLDGDSRLRLRGPIVSAPYLDATAAVLRHHRVRIRRSGRDFVVPGNQRFRGTRFRVPGDASSAAYLWASAATTGGRVAVDGIPAGWPQADLAVLSLLEAAGSSVRGTSTGATVQGRAHRPFAIDLTPSPDLYPLAGVLAATIPGRSRLSGAAHVVFKESDRRRSTIRLARAFGARVTVSAAGLAIEGTEHPRSIELRDLDDHRLVMAAAVGALAAEGTSSLADASAVNKSFPEFWDAIAHLAEVRTP
jgi:3-phosphoshikimate 1-carboxyvinyltransferase